MLPYLESGWDYASFGVAIKEEQKNKEQKKLAKNKGRPRRFVSSAYRL